MSQLCILHATLIRQPQPVEDVAILIDKGKIKSIGLSDDFKIPKNTPIIDAKGLFLAPGFIDLQINGAFGCDFSAEPTTIPQVAAQLPQYGVTSFLPTIITSPLEVIAAAQAVILGEMGPSQSSANPLGLHIEGPFLNPSYKGAHKQEWLRKPTVDAVKKWSPKTGIRLVTLAPELPKADKLIAALCKKKVVVSVGHSAASYEEATIAFECGVNYATHLFNAMPPLHHRDPALVGALLAHPTLTLGLIADGVHVHPELIKLVWRLAKERLNIVTDAVAPMGMPPGRYHLGEYEIIVDATSSRLADGTLAGSVMPLNAALRNLKSYTDGSLPDIIDTVTTRPATLLNLLNKGTVTTGADADLVLLDSQLNIQKTIIAGEVAYQIDI